MSLHTGPSQIRVIDISEPNIMEPLGKYETSSNYNFGQPDVLEGYVYVPNENKLLILDARNPANISLVAVITATTNIIDVSIKEHLLLIPDNGLRIFDISNPKSPTEIGSWNSSDSIVQIANYGTYAYLIGIQGLHIVDFSDTTHPREVSFFPLNASVSDIDASSGYVFLAIYENGLKVINATNPVIPSAFANWSLPGNTTTLDFEFGYVYVGTGHSGLSIFRFNPLIHEVYLPTISR